MRSFVLTDIGQRSDSFLNLVAGNVRGELAKFQYQPRLLAFESSLVKALSNEASSDDVQAANEFLIRSNDVSGAAATFLLDVSGRTVAASDGSIGRNYSYRPYFRQAMQGSLGRDFALDPTTGERSYYFAHPIRSETAVLGAVAIKVPIDLLEPGWLSPAHKILVLDGDGIVFLSSHPDWRFHSIRPLSDKARNRLILSRTYGTRDIPAIPVTGESTDNLISIQDPPWQNRAGRKKGPSTTYLTRSRSLNEIGWQVLILSDTKSVGQQINIWSAIVAFMMASILLFAANIYQRRRRYAERLALQDAAKEELEAQVKARTADLTSANLQLRSEISERQKTETRLRQTQAELVQATKMAALGQMSAGLSHELNQPLGAIRSYADNARTFLERAQTSLAAKNLASISELTERMGRIIKNLRTYSREEPVALRTVSVNDAISETRSLMDSRLQAEDVSVDIRVPDKELSATGGAVRLQQILVNLISNALDAMHDTGDKHLTISASETEETVTITVRDNGPGIPADNFDKLFDPFFSTKEVGEGMGLGLSITFGIVRQFGGEMNAANHPDGGAVFSVTLRRPEARTGEAA
ncbi:MAG: sensor histidine kinase [Alphaproteobacteria bacterium]